MSHEVVLGGKLAAKTSFSLSRPSSPRVEDLKGEPGSSSAAPGGSPSLWIQPPIGLSLGLTPLLLSPGAALYSRLKEYLLTEDQLKENGYPFPHPERPGGAVIFTAEEKKPKDCESLPHPTLLGARQSLLEGVGCPDTLSPLSLSLPTASCRVCCRCGTEYLVSSSGRCVRDEECYYHWGRLRRNRGEIPGPRLSCGWLPALTACNFLSLCCSLWKK